MWVALPCMHLHTRPVSVPNVINMSRSKHPPSKAEAQVAVKPWYKVQLSDTQQFWRCKTWIGPTMYRRTDQQPRMGIFRCPGARSSRTWAFTYESRCLRRTMVQLGIVLHLGDHLGRNLCYRLRIPLFVLQAPLHLCYHLMPLLSSFCNPPPTPSCAQNHWQRQSSQKLRNAMGIQWCPPNKCASKTAVKSAWTSS